MDEFLQLTGAGLNTTDTNVYKPITVPVTGGGPRSIRAARLGIIFMTEGAAPAAGDTCELRCVLRDSAMVYAVVQAVVTVLSTPGHPAGSGNERAGHVQFNDGSDILDALGARGEKVVGNGPVRWYIGFATLPADASGARVAVAYAEQR